MTAPPLRFGYTGLRVRNVRRSLRFYRALGFRIHRSGRMEHGGRWYHLARPGVRHRIELNFYPVGNRFYTPFRAGTEFDHFGFFTNRVDEWLRRALRAGGTLAIDLRETRERLVYVRDPDGNWIEFVGPPPKVRTAPAPASRRRRRRPRTTGS
jgi:catechol 2,3-dioxygenase-like lactoylglutathione lyase family enzyme